MTFYESRLRVLIVYPQPAGREIHSFTTGQEVHTGNRMVYLAINDIATGQEVHTGNRMVYLAINDIATACAVRKGKVYSKYSLHKREREGERCMGGCMNKDRQIGR